MPTLHSAGFGVHPKGNRRELPFLNHQSILWSGLALIFLTLILVYPFAMIYQGDPHGFRYLIRLGETLGIAVGVALLAGMVYLFSSR